MLPTLVFILIAYALYALHTAWSRRQGSLLACRGRDRKIGRFTVAASGLGLACLIFLAMWLPFESQEEHPKLAGLMLGQTDARLLAKAEPHLENLPIKSFATMEKPVYPFLHPEANYAQMLPEAKPAVPRALRKRHLKKVAEAKGKKSPASSTTAKKDKPAAKVKKKPEATPKRAPAAPAREASLRMSLWPTWDFHHHPPQNDQEGAR